MRSSYRAVFAMGLLDVLKVKGQTHVGGDNTERSQTYQPPPGPPPSHLSTGKETAGDEYAAPPGPPPTHLPAENPPPYHDWTSIPDTSLLPPPPALGHKGSKNNATWDDAARAHAFCDQFPPYTPSRPPPAVSDAVRNGDIALEKPREFIGSLRPASGNGRGVWSAKSQKSCGDCVLLSTLVRIKAPSSRGLVVPGQNLISSFATSPSILQPPTLLSSLSNARPSISKCALWV